MLDCQGSTVDRGKVLFSTLKSPGPHSLMFDGTMRSFFMVKAAGT
jgi:hypothetical protein